jgi:hypothetical protein
MMTTIGQKRNTKTELGELLTNEFGDRKLSSEDGQTKKARRLKDKQNKREVHRVRGRSSPRETMKKARQYITGSCRFKIIKKILASKSNLFLTLFLGLDSLNNLPNSYSIPSNILILLSRNSPARISRFMSKRFQRA